MRIIGLYYKSIDLAFPFEEQVQKILARESLM